MRKIISLLSALVISVVSFTGIANSADSKKPIVIQHTIGQVKL